MVTQGQTKANLICHSSHDVGQLLHDQVDDLNAGLREPRNLFLDDCLERHVGREQADSNT